MGNKFLIFISWTNNLPRLKSVKSFETHSNSLQFPITSHGFAWIQTEIPMRYFLSLSCSVFADTNIECDKNVAISEKTTVLIQSSLDSWLKMLSIFVCPEIKRRTSKQNLCDFSSCFLVKWNGKFTQNISFFGSIFSLLFIHNSQWFIQFTFHPHVKSYDLHTDYSLLPALGVKHFSSCRTGNYFSCKLSEIVFWKQKIISKNNFIHENDEEKKKRRRR